MQLFKFYNQIIAVDQRCALDKLLFESKPRATLQDMQCQMLRTATKKGFRMRQKSGRHLRKCHHNTQTRLRKKTGLLQRCNYLMSAFNMPKYESATP